MKTAPSLAKKITTFSFGSLALGLYLSLTNQVSAAIRNPVVDESLGGDGTETGATSASDGTIFATYFVILWKAFINIGGIAVLIYFLWGAIEWITSGGDSGKLQKARDKMVQAAIGLIILVSSFTILGFVSNLIFGESFNLLELTFPTFSGDSPLPPGSSAGGNPAAGSAM